MPSQNPCRSGQYIQNRHACIMTAAEFILWLTRRLERHSNAFTANKTVYSLRKCIPRFSSVSPVTLNQHHDHHPHSLFFSYSFREKGKKKFCNAIAVIVVVPVPKTHSCVCVCLAVGSRNKKNKVDHHISSHLLLPNLPSFIDLFRSQLKKVKGSFSSS